MNLNTKITFEDILNKTIQLWPSVISIKERIEIPQTGGTRYPDLVKAHDEVEKKLFELKDEFCWVMDWTIYKIVGECVQYQDHVYPHELNRDYIRKTFEEDLQYAEQPELYAQYDQGETFASISKLIEINKNKASKLTERLKGHAVTKIRWDNINWPMIDFEDLRLSIIHTKDGIDFKIANYVSKEDNK